ncbi:hypothetical protein [Streptomyces sp. NPDC004267]|uniref:hypothetical protein n=1 Tax=Streptomyces sp. NPDC004267 TaxID=3364694 RepID=UPI003679EE86
MQLISARQLGGSIVMDDLTGAITFTYESGTFHNLAQTANPLSLSIPECGTCGQWVGEHRNPNPTACDAFDVEPRPGTPANPLCPSEGCGQPRTHHGRPFTVACSSFEA